ncbi:hypothetical protein KAR91_29710 [Candidatus Pacearchaeota archaeon]|nr:hypothetical protein [Candidatus Pacearchaeota archaeon]
MKAIDPEKVLLEMEIKSTLVILPQLQLLDIDLTGIPKRYLRILFEEIKNTYVPKHDTEKAIKDLDRASKELDRLLLREK